MEIQISVRGLVEFILRSGDIDNRMKRAPEDSMQEGGRIHRMIQRRMGAGYHAEVAMRHCREMGDFSIRVEGRADGVIDGDPVEIDEIKGTWRDLNRIEEPVVEHLAQAKCYAYFYASQHGQGRMKVRVTYCNMETEEIRYFFYLYTYQELETWFEGILGQYEKWAKQEIAWKRTRQDSIKGLSFPFLWREGQKELATHVYHTICHGKKLFLEAPTGVGKTISTIFPAVQAIGAGKAERIFYLTAKTITRSVAEHTFDLLREKGLAFKTAVLTARDKICFLEEAACNPEACPYAKGHYDRINDAVYDLLVSEQVWSREKIESYAQKHMVCPFEMSLDMSLYADGIICDYNYLFDPHVFLKRFFAEGGKKEGYLFLIDEAHNLLERGREMYSAVLYKEAFLELKRLVKTTEPGIEKQLEQCNRALLDMKKQCESWREVSMIDSFMTPLNRLIGTMEEYLENHGDSPMRQAILDFYFEVSHFQLIYELVDEHYVMYTQLEEDGRFFLKLLCVDPSGNLKTCMERGSSSILFSATLLPIQYYKKLLGGDAQDYEVYAQSTFRPEKKALFLATDVTSRYARRSDTEFYRIAVYIHTIVNVRRGNYMVFFPSHSFLKHVYEVYTMLFEKEGCEECLVQQESMGEEQREEFLRRFEGNRDCCLEDMIHMEIETEEEKSLVGFCVLGGIFGEGIDLKNDRLIGVIIVGTGLPQVCTEREILRNYFSREGEDGFDYAYRYPGMNKVLQAAGRVIRTAEDVGLVALLDERFLTYSWQRMFPREWETYTIVRQEDVAEKVRKFWADWPEGKEDG